GLQRIQASGGTPSPLTTLDASRGETGHIWPIVIPGSRIVVFLSRTVASESNRIETLDVESGKRTVVAEADALVGYSEPWLAFLRGGVLLAQRFSPADRKLTGEPRRLLDGVDFNEGWGAARASIAGDTLAWIPALISQMRGV